MVAGDEWRAMMPVNLIASLPVLKVEDCSEKEVGTIIEA
jgi:hypothetical protein